jgi:hypothetical protein
LAFRKGSSWASWAPLVVALASLSCFQIALSSARAPTADWGDPDTAHRLWQHLSATSIREAFDQQIFATTLGPWRMHGAAMMRRLAEDLGPFGPLAALLALVALVRQREERELFLILLALLAVEVVYIVGINPMGGADRQTGIPLAFITALALGVALGPYFREGGPRLWLGAPLLGVFLVLPAAFLSVPDFAVTRSWAPHAWAREQLARLPTGSLLATQGDDLAAGTWAAQRLEGARPDVDVVVSQHLYRKVPDRVEGRVLAQILRPAFAACSEAERARSLAKAHAKHGAGPLIGESPGSDMLVALDWTASTELGLVLGGLHLAQGQDAPSPEVFVASTRAQVEALAPLLETHEDQRRLATALSTRVRAWLRSAGHDEANNQAAIAAYQILFETLKIELPGPLVSLGALVDRAGDGPRAIALTREALVLDPDRRLALGNLALYLSRAPETHEEALGLARRVAELYPGQIASWRRLEQICGKLGERECAARAAERRTALEQARAQRARAKCAPVGTSTVNERPTQ